MHTYRRLFLVFVFFLFLATVLYGKPYSSYGIIIQRNMFRPLWEANTIKSVNEGDQEKNRLEEQKRIEEERRKAEELRAIENKKIELSQNLLLSGVVFNGTDTSALITDQKSGIGGSYKAGDELNGAKIVSIDEKTQTVYLDYENKFQITLRIKSIR
ncbi:MAG: hypothetical protein PHV60_01045 [bacterium]|nr:hypothetical protein [bacterium]